MSEADRAEFKAVAGTLLEDLGYPTGDGAVGVAAAAAEGNR